MLNAINHYIQNQPYGSATAANESAESQATGTATKAGKPAPLVMGDYTPSTRAVLVSAVASDYDVRALDAKSLGTLQNKLLQYGLIGGRDLDAFSVINVARGEQADNDVIDALKIVGNMANNLNELGLSYSERQQIGKLNTLLHNLDSARQLVYQ
ncbi:MAG: hypothetical protein WAO12_01745 [Venatoribacter sp.]